MLNSGDIILTENFTNELIIRNSDNSTKLEWMSNMESQKKDCYRDIRTKIFCAAPTMDFEMYYNYLELLNRLYPSWVSYGLFDSGFVPFILLSFISMGVIRWMT